MLINPLQFSIRAVFPKLVIHDFTVNGIEDLIFQIRLVKEYEDACEEFRELSLKKQEDVLYPLVIRIVRFVTITTSYINDHFIVNPRALWEMQINNHFYKLFKSFDSSQINYSMFDMYQYRHEILLNQEVIYEDLEELRYVCRFNGICKNNDGCYDCDFSYQIVKEK